MIILTKENICSTDLSVGTVLRLFRIRATNGRTFTRQVPDG